VTRGYYQAYQLATGKSAPAGTRAAALPKLTKAKAMPAKATTAKAKARKRR